LGQYRSNTGDDIRRRVREVQALLDRHGIDLRVLPGGDVRIEDDLVEQLETGQVVSLGDHRRHVLLELPHELYMPIEPLLAQLDRHGYVGILSHPERNGGLLKDRSLIAPLVDRGCLMQVTCGSLLGTFGPASQRLAEWMLAEGLVHFLATDAHSPQSRRPKMRDAYRRACALVGAEMADLICQHNPAAVAQGHDVARGRVMAQRTATQQSSWWPWRRSA
jgi:protein-tyrosine phosphatase